MVLLLYTEAYEGEPSGLNGGTNVERAYYFIWRFGNPGPAVQVPPMHTGGRHIGVVALDIVSDLKLSEAQAMS